MNMASVKWVRSCAGALAGALCVAACAQGVPEPGIVLYGKVWEEGALVTSGDLTWTYTSQDGTVTVAVTAPLQSIEAGYGETFSYRVDIPAESVASDLTLSPNTLPATTTTVSYSRTAAIDGGIAVIAASDTSDTFSLAERGKVARLDLAKSGSVIPSATISGSVAYSGRQPGDVVVQIFDNPEFTGVPAFAVTMPDAAPAAFDAENLLAGTYYLRGFKDHNGDGQPQSAEAYAEFSGNPIAVPPDASAVTLTLLDADADDDGLPDWWEWAQLGTLASTGEADFDGDGESNADEYANNTDAADARSTHNPVNAYGDFKFSIWRGALQAGGGAFSEDRWGVYLLCGLPEGMTAVSAVFIKPAATTGDNPVALDVDSEPGTASWGAEGYASLAEIAADIVPGIYSVHVVMEGEGRAVQDLRFNLEMPAYDADSFPDYVTIQSPSPDAVDVPTGPLLVFLSNDWDTLWIRQQPEDTIVYRYAQIPGTGDSHTVADDTLAGGTTHTLDLRIVDRAYDRFASVTRVSFKTEPAAGDVVVTFAAEPHGTLSGELLQTLVAGSDCTTVIAHADPGYGFVQWTVGGLAFSTDNPLTVTNVGENLDLAAVFEIACHDSDQSQDWKVQLSPELTRIIQFYNSGGYHCEAGTEDGFAPGLLSAVDGPRHDADQNRDWIIQLSPELTRLIQFYNSGGYHSQVGTEDGYAPGLIGRKASPVSGSISANWKVHAVEHADARLLAVTLTVSHTLPKALRSLAVVGWLPRGWQYAGVLEGPRPQIRPLPGDKGDIGFAWIGIPSEWPLRLTMLLEKDEALPAEAVLRGTVRYRDSADEIIVDFPDLSLDGRR